MNTTMKRKTPLQRMLTLLLSLMLVLTMSGTAVFAASAPTIKDADYEGAGRVEVEFTGKVAWKNASVTVKDTAGKKYTATVIEKDSDEIEFKIKNYKRNTTYKFTIKGVAKKGTTSYTSVSGKVKIPAAGKIVLDDVDYDSEDKEVEFEFKGKVQWKSPAVTITDSSGKNYVTKILSKDKDSIEVKVKGMKEGKTYNYKITGIRKAGTKDYITLSGKFKAIDD